MKLTDLKIKSASAAEKAYKLRDEYGLFLLVTPTGGKLWRWKYRFQNREQVMSYDRYPDISVAAAREKHAAARSLRASGKDPMAEKRAAKQAERTASQNSFRTIQGLWFEHWTQGKSAKHVDATRRRIDANLLPELGRRPMTTIEASDMEEQGEPTHYRAMARQK